jgi:alpha-tubulin suppressor-like RCC1 family protein
MGLPETAHVRAGLLHSCAVGVDGSVWCWGTNDDGQLGDGTTTQRLQATRVKGF